jgi:hypothetical protein
MFKHVHLKEDFDKIIETDHRINRASCIETKIYGENSKFPKSLCLENTTIHQIWWDDSQVDFKAWGSQLKMEVATVSSILLPPGSIIPIHCDTFHKLRNMYPDRTNPMVRAVIYMAEYSPGQFTQVKNGSKYETYDFWGVGDGYIWNDTVPHVTVNGSLKDLYTLNISGFKV